MPSALIELRLHCENIEDAPGQPAPHLPKQWCDFPPKIGQQVDAFYRAALEAGGKDNGAPGLCPHYHANYYAAFVIGPEDITLKWFATNPRANPSINGTSISRLHPLAAAPLVKC